MRHHECVALVLYRNTEWEAHTRKWLCTPASAFRAGIASPLFFLKSFFYPLSVSLFHLSPLLLHPFLLLCFFSLLLYQFVLAVGCANGAAVVLPRWPTVPSPQVKGLRDNFFPSLSSLVVVFSLSFPLRPPLARHLSLVCAKSCRCERCTAAHTRWRRRLIFVCLISQIYPPPKNT